MKIKSIHISEVSFIVLFWAAIALLYLIYPFRTDPFNMSGFYLTSIFSVIILITYKSLESVTKKSVSENSGFVQFPSSKLTTVFFILSALGLFFHLWDKVFIREYDYFSCVDIRELWLQDGLARRSTISSLPSALGHLLIYCTLIPAIFSDLKTKKSQFFFVASILFFLIYAYTIVSRSTLLTFTIIALSASFTLLQLKSISLKNFALKLLTMTLIFLAFAGATFFKKISCKNVNSVSNFLRSSRQEHRLSLTAVPSQTVSDFYFEEKILNPIFVNLKSKMELSSSYFVGEEKSQYVLNMIALYAGNGINNFTGLTFKKIEPDCKYVLNPIFTGVNKVMHSEVFTLSQARKEFGQGFINLPGSLYLSFGRWGLYLSAFVIGSILFLTKYFTMKYKKIYVVPLNAFTFSIILLGPLVNSSSLMSAPFFGFLSIIFLILGLFDKKQN